MKMKCLPAKPVFKIHPGRCANTARKALITVAVSLLLLACGQSGGSSGNGTGTGTGTNAGTGTGGGSCYAAPSHQASSDGTTVLSGTVYYEDRTYDATGFTGVACLPVRNATVDLMRNSVVALTTTTDAAGAYSFAIPAAGTYYVRTLAQSGTVYNAVVKDNRDNSTYAVKSISLDIAAKDAWTVTLSAGMTGAGPAFNIYDNILKAQSVLQKYAPSATLPALTAYWYDGKTTGTYYSNGAAGHTLDILGSPTDSDAYDDSVILHETGHYAAAVFSKDSSGGGAHSLTGHYDLRLTWSEGWANFFSSLVKAEKAEPKPYVYVDTNGGTGTGSATLNFTFEIDTPSYASRATGADNEVAVANVLWTIYTAGATPRLGLGFADIWTNVTVGLKTDTYVTFEGFYDHWVATAGHPAGQLDPLLTARSIKYAADAYETDSSAATARAIVAGTSETHTFFGAGDTDWFKIAVTGGTAYTFATGALGDGCDTLMTLYNADGTTQLAQNDDEISGKGSSKISWTADATKTVYLKLEPYRPLISTDLAYSTSTSWPPQIVKYGSYTLTVQ